MEMLKKEHFNSKNYQKTVELHAESIKQPGAFTNNCMQIIINAEKSRPR